MIDGIPHSFPAAWTEEPALARLGFGDPRDVELRSDGAPVGINPAAR